MSLFSLYLRARARRLGVMLNLMSLPPPRSTRSSVDSFWML
uniref:Uncharacterized protein n=1 Tax=Arundo donax TaxID=35708 RepID=A0A0A9HUV0_ARUDO